MVHDRVMRPRRQFIATYIMTNKPRGTLYVGVTSNLYGRVYQHREGLTPGFTSRYGLKRLVWFQPFELVVDAIKREKALKGYSRAWKIELIEQDNPRWDDLYEEMVRGNPWRWKWDEGQG